jgi:hypothetical protein
MILLPILRCSHLATDDIAGAQDEAANLRLGDVDIIGIGMKVILAQKSVAVIHNLEDATPEGVTLLLSVRLKQSQYEVLLLQIAEASEPTLLSHAHEFLSGLDL